MLNPSIKITTEVLNLIAKIDEFKGEWKTIGNLTPERLSALKHVATIESIGSSTRIEGVKLTDREIELLLSGLDKKFFASRDEQEVAGYADVMNIVFESYEDISFTENYYLALRKSQATFKSDHPEYTLWVAFFLNALDAQKEMLFQKIEKEKIFIKLSKLSRQIINLVKDHGELSISEIESITKANRNTIKKKLGKLVKDKYLIIQGQGKGTRYVIGIKNNIFK